ncbi:sarcinarray family MAST domain-containing protein [Methanococcoides sp. SA1]|nr:sarcinarray family MAST domain-containing protein [Methanococcoides sp. SA1]
MNYKIFMLILIILILPNVATAYEYPYGEVYTYEVYYNGEIQGIDAVKPVLKIGEPFAVGFEMTVYQDCKVYIEIRDLGTGLDMENFVVVDGPSQLGESIDKIYIPNETCEYEWTLKPTEEWAGGSMPIEIHYEIIEKYSPEPLVNSEFTAVLPYISTEYYEDEAPATEEPQKTENKQTPAFTLPSALLAIALLATYNRYRK